MGKHTCTTFLVGKAATLDGSTIVCREEDYSNALDPQRFVLIKPEDQPRQYASKTTRFKIDLPTDPVAYTSTPDADDSAGVFAAGGINYHNVAMSGTESITTNSRVLGLDPYNEDSGIGEEDFVTLVLPYIDSARAGVMRLGKLLEKYGTYEANAISFSDQNEVWYMETIGGHHWAAVKIPDDAYVIAPNRFNITKFDFSDSTNNLFSTDLKEFIDQHQLNPLNGGYNLRLIFGSQTMTDSVYNNPRAWYVQKLLGNASGQEPTAQDLPFICHAKKKLAVEDIKQLMSSHYQNTPYDPYHLEKGKAPYRSIALNRNMELHILQIRNNVPADLAGIHWLAFGPNAFNTVVPFYAHVTDTPAFYRDTSKKYSPQNMYWLANTIAVIGDQYYQQAAGMVENFSQTVVGKTRHLQHITDQHYQPENVNQLTAVNDQMATIAQAEATDLLGKLVELAFKNAKLQF